MIFILIFVNLLYQSLPKFKISNSSLFTYRLNFVGILLAFFLVLNVSYVKSIGSGINLYTGFIFSSISNQYIEMFIYLISSLILISLINSIAFDNNSNPALAGGEATSTVQNSKESGLNWIDYYPLIILFNLLGASCLISSFDLLFMYIAIELQSFSLYILSTLNKNSINATSAGLKYFLIGGFASCLILLGVSLIYSSTGLTNFDSISILIDSFYFKNNSYLYESLNLWIQSGFIFLILGLLIKLGAAPLHQWAPDVYDKVPTKVTTWLVLIPKLSLFLFILEILNLFVLNPINSLYNFDFSVIEETYLQYCYGSEASISAAYDGSIINIVNNNLFLSFIFNYIKEVQIDILLKNILILSSLISLIIGSLLGLSQIRIKRLLAFSAISHIGFLLLSLSINTELSIESFFFYLIQYTVTNLNIFVIILLLGNILSNKAKPELEINYISELKGIFELNPILSLSLAVCLFSMAGVPPLIGFFGKQQILYSAISSDFIFISLIAISMSVISAYYYLNLIKISHFEKSDVNIYSLSLNGALGDKAKSNFIANFGTQLNINAGKTMHTQDKNIQDLGIAYNLTTILISTLTLSLLLFILKPNLLLNSTHILALALFSG